MKFFIDLYKIAKTLWLNYRYPVQFSLYHPIDIEAIDRRQCNICDGHFFPAMRLED